MKKVEILFRLIAILSIALTNILGISLFLDKMIWFDLFTNTELRRLIWKFPSTQIETKPMREKILHEGTRLVVSF